MRAIKFRIWDKEKESWLDTLIWNSANSFFHIDPDKTTIEWFRDNRFIIQQFTGAIDINGVEIYEGDIVKYTQHMFNTQKTTEKTKTIKWCDYRNGFNLQETEAGQSGFIVIGNVLENHVETMETNSKR